MFLERQSFRVLAGLLGLAPVAILLAASGCGARSSNVPPPIVLSVSLSNSTIVVTQGGPPVYVPVIIDAPTETATFTITGLPGGVSESYRESESNPSGQLTMMANAKAPLGTYKPTITVGSSGQTASLVFTLVISAANNSDASVGELEHNQ
jgi:hypothetical protein